MLLSFFDPLLIAPFRLLPDSLAGFWLGCAVLAFWCVLIGRGTLALMRYAGRGHYTRLSDEMHASHDLSMLALRAGDKPSFLAINSMAHERFGKHFFAQAALGMGSLWPAPFALAWLSLRFEGIELFSVPLLTKPVGYPFVFLLLYVAERLLWARLESRLRKRAFARQNREEAVSACPERE